MLDRLFGNRCVMCGRNAEFYDKNNKEKLCENCARTNIQIGMDK